MSLATAQKIKVDLTHKAFAGLISKQEEPKKVFKQNPNSLKNLRKCACILSEASKLQLYWTYYYSEKGYTYADMQKFFGVKRTTVYKIIKDREKYEKMLNPYGYFNNKTNKRII